VRCGLTVVEATRTNRRELDRTVEKPVRLQMYSNISPPGIHDDFDVAEIRFVRGEL
jgi:hypothetical protein